MDHPRARLPSLDECKFGALHWMDSQSAVLGGPRRAHAAAAMETLHLPSLFLGLMQAPPR